MTNLNHNLQHSKFQAIPNIHVLTTQPIEALTFDRSLEGLCYCDHDIGAEHPEDVVEEESAQEDAAGADFVELQELHAIHRERQAEQVVGNPVLKCAK